jgi:hypothetical protein
MAFWESIVAGGIGEMAKGVGSLAKDIRVAITGDDPLTAEQKARLNEQLQAMEIASQKAGADYDTQQMVIQGELNKIDAASGSIFRSGWRPAVGWVCVTGLGYTFLVKPLLPWVIQIGGMIVGQVVTIPLLPEVPMGDLIVLLGGMLGLGTMRTVERIKGVAK